MKCQILFSKKNKKNILKCHMLKFLHSIGIYARTDNKEPIDTADSQYGLDLYIPYLTLLPQYMLRFNKIL